MKGPKRNRNIVVKTQFNINGSRGKSVKGFITDYVSRGEATDKSMAYVSPLGEIPEVGDGVAFTLEDSAISRRETLYLADVVESYHSLGNRAIQQMVISFDPAYLVQKNVVPDDVQILHKGDYRHNYDDILLRNAVRSGMCQLIENEGYIDGRMVAAIQHDTTHIHVHAVVYEHFPKIGRKYKGEERGIIKESSLGRMTYGIDRYIENTKSVSAPTPKRLIPQLYTEDSVKDKMVMFDEKPNMSIIEDYLRLIEEQENDRLTQLELEKEERERQEKASEWLKKQQQSVNNDFVL